VYWKKERRKLCTYKTTDFVGVDKKVIFWKETKVCIVIGHLYIVTFKVIECTELYGGRQG
jgi:hypothetical protein